MGAPDTRGNQTGRYAEEGSLFGESGDQQNGGMNAPTSVQYEAKPRINARLVLPSAAGGYIEGWSFENVCSRTSMINEVSQ